MSKKDDLAAIEVVIQLARRHAAKQFALAKLSTLPGHECRRCLELSVFLNDVVRMLPQLRKEVEKS